MLARRVCRGLQSSPSLFRRREWLQLSLVCNLQTSATTQEDIATWFKYLRTVNIDPATEVTTRFLADDNPDKINLGMVRFRRPDRRPETLRQRTISYCLLGVVTTNCQEAADREFV